MEDEEFFEDTQNYEEEEENEDDEDDGVEFDVSKYVHKKDDEQEDPLDEEEKLRRLQDVFSCLPMVLIRRILRRDDVKGDLNTASERLQEFQDMENPFQFFRSPAAKSPEPRTFQEDTWNSSEGQNSEDANEATKSGPFEPRSGIPPKVKPKKRGKRARNQGRGRGMQMEQEAPVEGGGPGKWINIEDELKTDRDAEYRGHRGRGRGGYRGQRRGGPRVGTGGGADENVSLKEWHGSGEKTRGEQIYEICQDGWDWSGGQVGFKPQRNQGNPQGRGNSMQMEQEARVEGGGPGKWINTEDELKTERNAEYRGHRGRGRGGYHGQRRGGPRVGTGGGADESVSLKEWHGSGEKTRGEQIHEICQDGWDWSGGQVGFKPQRGRGNRGGREYQRRPRGQNNSERRRSHQGQFQSSPRQFHEASERGTSGGQQGRRFIGRNEFADDNVDTREERGHESPRRMSGNWVQGQGGMKQAQSMPAINQTFDKHRHDETLNEQETPFFEQKKLLVSGLHEKTTDDGVTNFIEAMSREEVEEVVMLGKGRALVTMLQSITNFTAIKQRGERRGLDSSKVCIEKVPLCRSILVSGISPKTTHDSIALYFESRRSNGGPVDKVKFEPGSERAVVIFENPKDMERVVAQQENKPHVIAKVQVSVRIFHDFLDTDEVFNQSDDQLEFLSATQESGSTQVSRKLAEETTGQQLHIAVDPDVMEYVTTSAHLRQWNDLLAAKNSEVKWKPLSKVAVMLYHGEEVGDSWQSECIDSVQSFLGKFGGCDVEVNKDFWKAVKEQVASIRTCLGDEPPLIKAIDNSSTLRIVCLSSEFKTYEEKLKAKLEEIYREETRKTYLKRKIPNIPEEHLVLLKKVKFAEKLQVKNKELVILLDSETEEIYFEGPQPQFTEATMKFHKLISEMAEKKLNLSRSILEVLGSTEGLSEVRKELEANNVEAVFVIDGEAKIVGISSAHADKAAGLLTKLTVEEKVRVHESSVSLLKTPEWRELCDQINKSPRVCIHRNSWNDTWVAGFRSAVTESMKALQEFLDENCKREEKFTCPSQIMKRYLTELRQQDLRSVEEKLQSFNVKVQEGKGEHTFTISGKKEGLKQAKKLLEALIAGALSNKFDVKQPGLKKYFTGGKGDRLVKSVEKEQECVVQVERHFRQALAGAVAATNNDDSTDSDDEVGEDGLSAHAWVSPHGHKVSWKPGDIATEKAHTLVSAQGACAQAITKVAGGPLLSEHPKTGEIVVSSGNKLACSHVIHTSCCNWNGGTGEVTLRAIIQKCLQKVEELGGDSVAFPVIGTGNLQFPPNVASKIMLDETISYCQTNQSSKVKDIRFVVYQQDQNLITAFQQEMRTIQTKDKQQPVKNEPFFKRLQSLLGKGSPYSAMHRVLQGDLTKEKTDAIINLNSAKNNRISIEVLHGDLTKERTDAIVNINSTDMNMENAGALSKAVAQASGFQVTDECRKLGQQPGGSVALTQGGNLAVGHIIHMVPGSSDIQHLRICLEKCLDRAEAEGFRVISLPAVGTGGFGVSATDSAQLTFQALNNFSTRSHNLRRVRIVVFQAQMVQAFQQEQHRCAISPASLDKEDLESNQGKRGSLRGSVTTAEQYVTLSVTGKCQADVSKAVDALKKGFSEACVTMKVENEGVSKLSERQIASLWRKAESCDVKLEFEADVDRVVVRGEPSDASGMVGEIWHEISERSRKDRDREQALLVSKNIEWRYEIRGVTMPFDSKANAKIELAHTKNESKVTVSLRGEKFVIDLGSNIGIGQRSQDQITASRKVKGVEEGIALPKHWTPMPQSDMTVHTVQLLPGSTEYLDVVQKVHATASNVQIQKIERVQNPHLYQSYMVRKQKMDKDNGGNNERQLFHGTNGSNIKAINTQGFNRSFCGQHGTAYGRGVYFARDASYSVGYAGRGGSGGNSMYLARVLVGKYCQGNSSMIVPPAKDSSRPEILFESVVNNVGNPSIFVVFYDTQCYPEYLITF